MDINCVMCVRNDGYFQLKVLCLETTVFIVKRLDYHFLLLAF